jgi:hypothetical protein
LLLIFGAIDERDRPMSSPIDRTGNFVAVRFELVSVSLLESTPFGGVMVEPFAQCSRRRVLLPPLIDTCICLADRTGLQSVNKDPIAVMRAWRCVGPFSADDHVALCPCMRLFHKE